MSETIPEAQALDFKTERDNQTESWTRADAQQAEYEPGDELAEWVVRLPDSDDSHLTYLVEDDDTFLGFCTCKGFKFHDGPCAHLCARRKMTVTNDIPIPDVQESDRDLEADAEDFGAEVDQETDVDDVQDHLDDPERIVETADDQEGKATVDESPTPVEANPAEIATEDATGDPFVQSLEDVDERFVVTMRGEPHVRRAGYAALAQAAGFGVDVEAEVPADETDFEYARYRATVRRDGEAIASDVGTAHVDVEDMSGARGNLDELAATRALKRALEWATGAGRTAAETEGSA